MLSKKLENRRNFENLIDCNILKSTPGTISPKILQSSVAMKFKKAQDDLSIKLKRRPNREDLMSSNIIKYDEQVSPLIHKTMSSMLFKVVQIKLQSKLDNRPTKEALLTHNILQVKDTNIEERIDLLILNVGLDQREIGIKRKKLVL